jgi:arylsulfate sulfotransferase
LNGFRPRMVLVCFVLAIIEYVSGCNSSSFGDPPQVVPVISPSSAVLLPGQTVQFSVVANGAPVAGPIWLINNVQGGSAATGTITSSGLYTAPSGATGTSVQVSVKNLATHMQSAPATVTLFDANNFQRGTVSPSSVIPLVAVYNMSAPQGSTVQVQFGTTTNYGLTTSLLPAPAPGGVVSTPVAGMRASTTYHMQATVHLPDGKTVKDTDQTFTTGALPPYILPNITVQQTPGLTPASGVELLSMFEDNSQAQVTAVATDLAGNVIWYYPIQPAATYPIKPLSNGHMLINVFGQSLDAIQEIDLAGNVISQVSLSDVQQGLAAAVPSFPQIINLHHDMTKLPNGHLIMLVNFNQTVNGPSGSTTVLADGLVDWDPVRGVVWAWSTVDHIPISHAPNGTADWTHANAVVYSPDDGNLLLSMRNQNWIIKINYDNGAGDGSILWHLGPNGDFTLPAGDDPVEWNYGQHYPVFLGPNTSGIFPLTFFNNGNNRMVDAADDLCGTPGLTACYSSVPVMQLNEYTKTAQVLDEVNLTPAFSFCCGNVNQLANGDYEYDIAYDLNKPENALGPNLSYIQEVTPEIHPQLVWQMNISGQLAYRGFRIPSFYPGVEWTQSAIAAANVAAKSAQKAAKQ